MSDPTFVPLHTGDTADDDAEIFGDYLQQSPNPPEPPADTPVVAKTVEPPKLTRILGTTYKFTAPVTAFQAAWKAPGRQELHVSVASGHVFIGSERDSCFVKITANMCDVSFCHTGTLWVLTNNAVGAEFAVWEVSK